MKGIEVLIKTLWVVTNRLWTFSMDMSLQVLGPWLPLPCCLEVERVDVREPPPCWLDAVGRDANRMGGRQTSNEKKCVCRRLQPHCARPQACSPRLRRLNHVHLPSTSGSYPWLPLLLAMTSTPPTGAIRTSSQEEGRRDSGTGRPVASAALLPPPKEPSPAPPGVRSMPSVAAVGAQCRVLDWHWFFNLIYHHSPWTVALWDMAPWRIEYFCKLSLVKLMVVIHLQQALRQL